MAKYFAWFGLPGTFVITMLLSAFALLRALVRPKRADRWICFAAMALSTCGDLFLTNFRGLMNRFPNGFVIGAAFFAVAHVVYLIAYRMLAKKRSIRFRNPGAAAGAVIFAGLLAYITWVCLERNDFTMYPVALVYLPVISANCCTVLSYAWGSLRKRPWTLLAAVGALTFLASDFIIGLGLLAGISRYDYLIWWLYPIGQLLLIAFEN